MAIGLRGRLLGATLIAACPGWAMAQDASAPVDDVIVVTATRTAINLSDAPASLSVVTADQIELTAAVDALDIVRQTPGISFQGRGVSGRQALSIRGMGSDQTLFMVDGRRTIASDNVFGHSNYQYNWLPVSAIDRVEVVRGPLSALYGSEAMGGVVNIITRDTPDSWGGSVAARYGSAEGGGDRQFAGLYGAGPLGDQAGLLLSYTFNDQGEVPLAEDIRVSELEGRQSHNAYARLDWEPAEGHRFVFDVAATREDRFRNTNVRGRPPFHESSYDLDKAHAGASYTGSVGMFDLALNAYHSELEAENFASAGVNPTRPQTLKDDVFDGHVVWEPVAGHILLAGGELRRETLVHPAVTGGAAEVRHNAVFVQDEWDVSDNLRITLGARFDDHEHFGSEISPRVYAVFHVSDRLSLKAGYGHGFRAPTVKQASPAYRFIGPNIFLGNAAVGPETSDNFEFGITYRGERLDFGATVFTNTVEDLITLECISNCFGPVGGTYHYVNIAQAETRGLEAEASLALSDRVNLRASHVYMESEDGNGRRLAERPEHTFSASLDWQFDQPDIAASLRAQFIGDQVDYARGGAVLDLPGYTLWHASASWDVNETWQVDFGVRNLTDVRLAEESPNYGFAEQARTIYAGFRRAF